MGVEAIWPSQVVSPWHRCSAAAPRMWRVAWAGSRDGRSGRAIACLWVTTDQVRFVTPCGTQADLVQTGLTSGQVRGPNQDGCASFPDPMSIDSSVERSTYCNRRLIRLGKTRD